jgi:hypothetical protein
VVEILGAATGMLLGLAALAIAVWEYPTFRRAFFSDYTGFVFVGVILLASWAGYWTFATLFSK